MSFRTVCQFDMTRADVERDIADRDRLHKRLMSLFPDGLGDHPRLAINLIFTVEPSTGELLFQSDLRPVLGPLNEARNGYFSQVITKPLEEVDCNFETGDTVEFRLWFAAQMRPTGSKKRVDIEDNDEIVQKITAVLSKVGLDVSNASVIDWLPIRSAKRNINYKNAEVVGSGLVTDSAKLKEAIVRGVGGMRLWGSGVLLITKS